MRRHVWHRLLSPSSLAPSPLAPLPASHPHVPGTNCHALTTWNPCDSDCQVFSVECRSLRTSPACPDRHPPRPFGESWQSITTSRVSSTVSHSQQQPDSFPSTTTRHIALRGMSTADYVAKYARRRALLETVERYWLDEGYRKCQPRPLLVFLWHTEVLLLLTNQARRDSSTHLLRSIQR